ncbi:hypothetical protein gpAD87_05255 [Paenibacillus sp. AD87]|nr:hypothetical protein gpAD87_05255 [Paenibacillus sp. AD87]
MENTVALGVQRDRRTLLMWIRKRSVFRRKEQLLKILLCLQVLNRLSRKIHLNLKMLRLRKMELRPGMKKLRGRVIL